MHAQKANLSLILARYHCGPYRAVLHSSSQSRVSPPSRVSPHSRTHRSPHLSHSHAELPTSLEALSTSCCTRHMFLKLSSLYLGSYVSEQSAQFSNSLGDGPGQRDFLKSFDRDTMSLELLMTDSDSNCDFYCTTKKRV